MHLNALPLGETMFKMSIPDRGWFVIGGKAISSTSKGHLSYEQRTNWTGNDSTPGVVHLLRPAQPGLLGVGGISIGQIAAPS